MFERILKQKAEKYLNSGKAIVIIGPRQTGKTTLLRQVTENYSNPLFLDCDDKIVAELLADQNTEKLRQLLGNADVVFIDEAQRVVNIGITLKIIIDQLKPKQLLVSGSSSFDLMSTINEPLTGRKWEWMLFPISWEEFQQKSGFLNALQQLENRLIFGMYPEVLNNTGNEISVLKQLTNSYLYKDLLSYQGIRKPDIIDKLLRALAFQVGSEVSYNELSNMIGVDKNTINTYIDLLEKAFIVFRLNPFSRNLRNEIKTSRKIYFYDNGIRNALISNFNPIEYRNDVGPLWENFLISERMKWNHYHDNYSNTYFWRTVQQQEIDYLEEREGNLFAYEFKWNPLKKSKIAQIFMFTYPNHEFRIIHKDNFQEFLLAK
jgi:hypothetical protein